MPRKRAAEPTLWTAGDGLGVLKRLATVSGGGEPESAAAMMRLAWSRRLSAPRVLFRASRFGLAEVISKLLPAFWHGPCPSPVVIEYLKEMLVMSWATNSALVDATIVDICSNAKCAPQAPFHFAAVADVCRTFLWNVWCKREPGDPETDSFHSSETPSGAVLPCLRLFLLGIEHWHDLCIASNDADRIDPMIERNMEVCAAGLRQTFGADLFAERLPSIVSGAPQAWKDFTSRLRKTEMATRNVMKLKDLWEEVRMLSDPLSLLMASEPTFIRELAGSDLQSDDVTRRTLMLAMWASMDRSELSDAGSIDPMIQSLALLVHDLRCLQGSKSSHFIYNMWLSCLFILNSNKADTPERIVGRHFLLCHLPKLFKTIIQLESQASLTSTSPLTNLVDTDDSFSTEGALEQAFARVRLWPQFLHINIPAPAAGTTNAGAGAAARGAGSPDVWLLVSDAFLADGMMKDEQVAKHIKPLATWKRDTPVPVGAEGLRKGSLPQTAEDVMALEDAIISEFSAWNAANPTAPSPRSCCALWQLCCDEVVRGSRCSPHAARVMANILGVPKDLPPEPAPPPVAPAPPPAGAAAAQTASAHAHAATVAAQTLPTWSIQPHVYLELARLAAANLAVMDVLHATAMLESVILGLVYRVDILGGHVPPTPPEPPTPEAPPMQPGDLVHDIYNELFLMICQLVNRYKLHQNGVFLQNLEAASTRWAPWAQRGCFHLWLRRHTEIQRQGKLQMEDRTVENKLVDAIFNQNWGKKEPLQRAVRHFAPWAVLECVPSFAERVFQGCCAKRMETKAAAAALLMLISVVRYAMPDTIAHLSVSATTSRNESAGESEMISSKQAVEVLSKLLEDITNDKSIGPIVQIDRNLALVLARLPDTKFVQTLKSSLDLSPVDLQAHKKVIYDVLVGIHKYGPQLRFSQDIRLLRNRCKPYEVALGMLTEVMQLSAQGNSAPSFATMFNLASIGSFLLSHSGRAAVPGEGACGGGGLAARSRNVVAEHYMLRVLPDAWPKLDTPRQALLLARFTTMLAIFNGAAAWCPLRGSIAATTASGDDTVPAKQALEAAFGPIAPILERLAATCCWPAPEHGAGAEEGGKDAREMAILTYALSMLCHALRVRWLARFVDLERASRAVRRLGYCRLALLCRDRMQQLAVEDRVQTTQASD